ncbi:MAG: undecaprenyl/decaprenyl-phosphate alpha-N-acetylglucosaminyl 1-phosphate transferase [Endomicrobia bacterium]|nr:undecaprenyl/decaprenyl-phosphate alpha-N-acetylglucosaminyl 1-phosphate transferase [Endomicrobiia bacterium]MCX7716448.1 undecaprenyl/decaprenyl-phosphate alpha-N-acetylglucosaminyl 1-phosphate transferase [Endomicrobiia bacterium]
MLRVYILCLLLPFFLSIFLVPFSNWLAKKLNIYDRPSKRKIKFKKLTRWAGIGMFISFFLSLLFIVNIFPEVKNILAYRYTLQWGEYQEVVVLGKQLLGLFFASVLIVIIGSIDDKSGLPPIVKFLVQIIVAYCAMDYGVRILGVNVPLDNKFIAFPRIVSQIVTILWLCGFMNMVNLVDGVDGLAGGIVLISSFTFFVISILQKQVGTPQISGQLVLSSILSLILCGCISGFLIYNFYPAKLYMGDTGALWLGLVIGCITTVGLLKTGAMISFIIPVIVAGIPFVDVLSAIIRRIKKGSGIATADKHHIHHILLSSGWTEREVVLFFYVITLFLSIIAITIVALKR